MRIIIIEDEITAVRQLETLLKAADPKVEILARLESVHDTVKWIGDHPAPDLAFFDIQLADDISFRIFEQCEVTFPVVFVTAYDDYLLQAFEHNSIHYLLKPLNAEKVAQALQKVRQLERHFAMAGLRQFLQPAAEQAAYRSRLIVRKGLDYAPLEVGDIAYIFTDHKISFARTWQDEHFMVDQSLSELEAQLDPSQFFRANRQYLVNIRAIRRFKSTDQSKILLELTPAPKEEVTVGKDRAGAFRGWVRG
ncbi:MAG TPA: LytTR family DNA-binding domain-containing protein [Flavilitoribacter sp.]|nr:LytTR family DNA-binding domain-containing protein [Flavilitoribacter sp.]HMQ90315.1 LytTR family DNA-binding domain-containing protein [Flavilitoribacter sp.]